MKSDSKFISDAGVTLPVVIELKRPVQRKQPDVADIMFVVDTTGSLADEAASATTTATRPSAAIK